MNNKANILKTLMTSATAKVSAFGWGVLTVSLVNQDAILEIISNFIDNSSYTDTIYLSLNFLIGLLTQYGVIVNRRNGDVKPLIIDR